MPLKEGTADEFTSGVAFDPETEHLQIDLPSYEGPLDLLVELARNKKVDLNMISVLEIADQFLEWLRRARTLKLELAADWLVMAATLALLKSRILIPAPKEERAEAEAAFEDLASRLKRLDAVRSVVEEFSSRRMLGTHWYRPVPADIHRGPAKRLDATLHTLLSAYVREARITLAPKTPPVRRPFVLVSVEEAIRYLQKNDVLGDDWKPLLSLLPKGKTIDRIHARSKIAAAYVASLEMGKRGLVEIRQDDDEPIVSIRRKEQP